MRVPFWGTVLVFLVSCGTSKNVITDPKVKNMEAETVFQALLERRAASPGILYSGSAQVKAKDASGKVNSSEMEFLVTREGFVRMAPYYAGMALISWSMNMDSFVYQNLQAEPPFAYQGKSTLCNFRYFLAPLNLELSLYPKQIAEMVIGEAPLLPTPTQFSIQSISNFGEGGAELLTIKNDKGMMEKIWLSSRSGGDVLQVEWYEKDASSPHWRMEHKNFESLTDDRYRFPSKTIFTDVSSGYRLQFSWYERVVKTNVSSSALKEVFTIPPLKGVITKELVCQEE